jgi:hypothetical protein
MAASEDTPIIVGGASETIDVRLVASAKDKVSDVERAFDITPPLPKREFQVRVHSNVDNVSKTEIIKLGEKWSIEVQRIV